MLNCLWFCWSGYYQQGKIVLNDGRWLHVVHHSAVGGETIGRFLCRSRGHSSRGHASPNIWSRYDWCHYRNWGSTSDSEDLSQGLRDHDESAKNIFFVVFSKGQETYRIALPDLCITGDWNYGLKLVDTKTKAAFAFVFGDALVDCHIWKPF